MLIGKHIWTVWMSTVAVLAPSVVGGQEPPGSTADFGPAVYRADAIPTATDTSMSTLPYAAVPASAAQPFEEEYVLISPAQLKALEPWRIGEYKVVPYGVLWADMIYATERTFPGAYALWIPSPQTEGEPDFTIDARRTRLGLNITGPDVWLFGGSKSGGQVEIDFFGASVNENQAGVMVRHMYWEVKNERWRMLVGQTWDVIAPLLPNTCSYSVGWDGGNMGYRRPQFRWDRYLDFSPNLLGIFTIALTKDVVTDFATNSSVDRESASWPVIQSRIGCKLGDRGEGGLPIEMGVSGHIGRTQFDFNAPGPVIDDYEARTWSLNYDLKMPLNEYCGFQGEVFTGENLGPFLGGIGQGICPVRRTPIRSTGGWGEFWYYWTPQLHSHLGYGIDDPLNSSLDLGRSYNSFLFINLVYDITKKFAMGFEVTNWKTFYVADGVPGPTEPADSWVFEWMCKYAF